MCIQNGCILLKFVVLKLSGQFLSLMKTECVILLVLLLLGLVLSLLELLFHGVAVKIWDVISNLVESGCLKKAASLPW